MLFQALMLFGALLSYLFHIKIPTLSLSISLKEGKNRTQGNKGIKSFSHHYLKELSGNSLGICRCHYIKVAWNRFAEM